MQSGNAMLALHAAMLAAMLLIAGAAGHASETETTMSEALDFKTLEKATSPNRWLVAPASALGKSEADAAAPTWGKPPADVFTALVSVVEAEGAYSGVAKDNAAMTIRFVATVPVFGFKDDVDAVILPADGGSTIAIYSRSRVGYSDFGVNKKRVDRIVAALDSKLN
ncbi:MAG: DUF1499 domain-containing protein [Pseudomonadota bacterium]